MGDNSSLTIAVMGATGTGKSSFINLASGSGFEVGTGLLSCTAEVQTSRPFHFMGREITLIDTPGFDDSFKSDHEILVLIGEHLSQSYRKNQKLSGIIYMHRISDFKMNGISRRNFTMFRSLCGESTFRNVAIVTNMWGEVNEERGVARQEELATSPVLFKPVLDKGATMLRHYNSKESADAILSHFLDNHPITLQIQDEIVHQNKSVAETSAGVELEEEKQKLLEEEKRRHEEHLQQEKERLERMQREKEEQRRIEAEAARREQQARLERQKMEHEKEKRRLEEQRRQEAERTAQLQRRMAQEAAARFRQEKEEERLREEIQRQEQRAREEHARLQHELERARQEQERMQNEGGCVIC